MKDLTNAIDEKLTKILEKEQEKLLERLTKSNNELQIQIKSTEKYTAEKFDYVKDLMLQVDQKAGAMATIEMIDGLKDDNKNLKLKFEMEFEQFQQYLKDQGGRFNVINSRLNAIEKTNKTMKNILDSGVLPDGNQSPDDDTKDN